MPKDGGKDDGEDAMFSKKPLGGFSCASCDKNVTNLQRCQSVESISWNQLPYRDRAEKFSKIGAGFSKVLNSLKSEIAHNSTYKSKIKKLGEISESMSEYNQSKVEEKVNPK
mmetsp:Transcript_8118/g.9217  ORF Transcript_8118/g.9217 Transcript_8118/m.9217 type:complete len:112 (-) Transcript_8118:68-403(-)